MISKIEIGNQIENKNNRIYSVIECDFYEINESNKILFQNIFKNIDFVIGEKICEIHLLKPRFKDNKISNMRLYVNQIKQDMNILLNEFFIGSMFHVDEQTKLSSDKNINYIVGFSYLSNHLKKFGFDIYDIPSDELKKLNIYKDIFSSVGFFKNILIKGYKGSLHKLLSLPDNTNQHIDKHISENYFNDIKIDGSIRKKYKKEDIKAAIRKIEYDFNYMNKIGTNITQH